MYLAALLALLNDYLSIINSLIETFISCAQKREEEERQKGEEEVRCAEEKRVKELYMSLQQEQKQSEDDDKEWQEQCKYLLANIFFS